MTLSEPQSGQPAASPQSHVPNIPGIILLLMFIILLARPVTQALGARFETQLFAQIAPAITKDPAWIAYLATVITHLIISITLAVATFLCMVTVKRASAVRFAIAGFWLLWPVSILVAHWQSTYFISRYFGASQVVALSPFPTAMLAAGSLIALGWTAYLLTSRQARQAYPHRPAV